MFLQEVSDPRLYGISVTDVSVDRELAFANVYISALEGNSRWDEIHEGLESASGYLRHELAQRIDLRVFPRLRFHWDVTFERAERIEQLFASLHAEDRPQIDVEDLEDGASSENPPESTKGDQAEASNAG